MLGLVGPENTQMAASLGKQAENKTHVLRSTHKSFGLSAGQAEGQARLVTMRPPLGNVVGISGIPGLLSTLGQTHGNPIHSRRVQRIPLGPSSQGKTVHNRNVDSASTAIVLTILL